MFVFEAWEPRAQVDDAFISFRYAENLLAGRGLVFNPGEYVEGFTNLLWTLLVAGGIGLGFDPEAVGHALGIASGLATLLAAFAWSRALLPRAQAALASIAPWIVFSSPSFAIWSMSGMETPLFVATVTAAFASQARGHMGRAIACAILATLTRPEGVLAAGVLLAFHLLTAWRGGWRAWAPVFSYAVCLALLTGFRLAYYGSPVPNTFYAKVGGIPIAKGIEYLVDFLWSGSFLLVLPAALAVARDRRTWPGACFVVLLVVYVVAIGGDTFPGSRFLLPALALLAGLGIHGAAAAWTSDRRWGAILGTCLPGVLGWQLSAQSLAPCLVALPLAAGAWAQVRQRSSRRALALGSFAAALVAGSILAELGASWVRSKTTGLQLLPSGRVERLSESLAWDEATRRMALWHSEKLRGRRPPPRLVATIGVGALGYYSKLPMLDLVGITDATVARSAPARGSDGTLLPGHQRANVEYVLARRPDVIVVRRSGSPAPLPVEAGLWEHPEFRRRYAWSSGVHAYVRRR